MPFFIKQLALVLCLFSYSFQAIAKTIVISDIDDTIKKSNAAGKFKEKTYHFFKKVPYLEMRDLFNEIKENEIKKSETIGFYYISAAQKMTFDEQKWLTKHKFPRGFSVLKSLKHKGSTYDFKYATIKKIIASEMKSNGPLKVLMFGDNAQVDALVYSDLTRDLKLESDIYIRDVRAEATFFDSTIEVKKVEGVKYYFSEIELISNSEFDYLSREIRTRIYDAYKKRDLIPAYTFTTMYRRLETLYHDKKRAREDASKFWNDYYLRF